jgi:hypothetical protein
VRDRARSVRSSAYLYAIPPITSPSARTEARINRQSRPVPDLRGSLITAAISAGFCSDRKPWGKGIIQPVVPMPCHRKVRAVGSRRRLHDGQARTGPAIPGVSRDLREGYRQQREKERENPPHSYPAHSAYLVYFVRWRLKRISIESNRRQGGQRRALSRRAHADKATWARFALPTLLVRRFDRNPR